MASFVLFANVLSPLLDMVISLSAPVHDTVYAVSVHGSTALLMSVIAAALRGSVRAPAR